MFIKSTIKKKLIVIGLGFLLGTLIFSDWDNFKNGLSGMPEEHLISTINEIDNE